MKLTEAIAKRLNDILKSRGLKQYYLYKNGGVPKSTISDVLNCRKKRVSTETIYQICSTLGISLKEFFSDSMFDNLED